MLSLAAEVDWFLDLLCTFAWLLLLADPIVYEVNQAFTANQDIWLTSVNAMRTGWGGDAPEAQLIAIKEMVAGLPWRDAAVHVVVLTTDAPFHTGLQTCAALDKKTYDYGTMQQGLDALKSKAIKFVGICQPGCDATQMQFLASATGGSVIMVSVGFTSCR